MTTGAQYIIEMKLRVAAEVLLKQQRPGTIWADLSEAEKGNYEADAEAVLAVAVNEEATA